MALNCVGCSFLRTASHTLDDYRKLFNAYILDQPIVVATVDTLEWVVDSPPELHLVRCVLFVCIGLSRASTHASLFFHSQFEEYPALKLTPDANGHVDQ